MHSNLPLVEPIAIADIFVNGLADIEDLGDDTYRVILYSKRKNIHDHNMERVVVAALVMTRDTMVRCIFQSAKIIDLPLATEVGRLPRDGETLN